MPSSPVVPDTSEVVHDRRSLTYANSFDSPLKSTTIRAVEWMSGKLAIIRMVRRFEKMGAPRGQAFWPAALNVMGIDLQTPDEELARIPKTGPVVLVANHPHGLTDGMILADLIGRVRPDYKILTRALLTGIDEVASSFMIPVPFPYDPEAQQKYVEMRRQAMAHLKAGGLITLFPSGVVASSDTMFGPVIEREWNVFTAQMIRRSGAQVVPVRFPGANSRLYHVANRFSATLRQGLLLHEIVKSCNKPHKPVIGHPITDEERALVETDPRGFMNWLRAHTLSLES
ncbi:lysophospholipid acyltransferase family protein [Rhodalgimonas zhirmunskyi]|uniref:Lysophospholipid acyltransferase family protein n=1 Tax=Rhodalgimonas zhirmunskyi TaxID=2964767 RepID=A0AAJ1X6Y6_9RHOB|nr:lysophospholipid acyltransferase family protein [Rhodoalgimonas zhirmunskyi]MDQ2095689.1 lysophospholipid acyltransferase family protein [Rhodoalgimonas zhirmunskyi]